LSKREGKPSKKKVVIMSVRKKVLFDASEKARDARNAASGKGADRNGDGKTTTLEILQRDKAR
jgi:hypothetical protein